MGRAPGTRRARRQSPDAAPPLHGGLGASGGPRLGLALSPCYRQAVTARGRGETRRAGVPRRHPSAKSAAPPNRPTGRGTRRSGRGSGAGVECEGAWVGAESIEHCTSRGGVRPRETGRGGDEGGSTSRGKAVGPPGRRAVRLSGCPAVRLSGCPAVKLSSCQGLSLREGARGGEHGEMPPMAGRAPLWCTIKVCKYIYQLGSPACLQ